MRSAARRHAYGPHLCQQGPLDRFVLDKHYRLFNVNNLRLARFKEIFPGAAKTDVLDIRKILELFRLKDFFSLGKDALEEMAVAPEVNEKLKGLSRRCYHLVNEKIHILNCMRADL